MVMLEIVAALVEEGGDDGDVIKCLDHIQGI